MPEPHNTASPDVVDLIDGLLRQAVQARASDIHFEPTAEELLVKFRLDGVLSEIEKLPKSLADSIITRLKVMGGVLTYRNDVPQEGRIELPDLGKDVSDLRLAVFPTIQGQRAVVRVFYEHRELTDLDCLGFSAETVDILKGVADGQEGVLLLTGPAGSGKSTTLVAMLRYILDRFPGKSIVTLEDPVERTVSGVTQIEIKPHGEMTFPIALRSLLRQDPEVLMIGEIRDAETARIAIEAGLTGHLLMSTLHSGSPAGALLRLLDMGIEPYQITSSIVGVVNQRLVRKLCPQCKSKDNTATGCPACLQTGYHGRALIAEAIQIDSGLRQAILAKADLAQLESILAAGDHKTLHDHGRRLMDEGITSGDELKKLSALRK